MSGLIVLGGLSAGTFVGSCSRRTKVNNIAGLILLVALCFAGLYVLWGWLLVFKLEQYLKRRVRELFEILYAQPHCTIGQVVHVADSVRMLTWKSVLLSVVERKAFNTSLLTLNATIAMRIRAEIEEAEEELMAAVRVPYEALTSDSGRETYLCMLYHRLLNLERLMELHCTSVKEMEAQVADR